MKRCEFWVRFQESILRWFLAGQGREYSDCGDDSNARCQSPGSRAGCGLLLAATHLREKPIILPVGPNPEPQDVLAIAGTDCPISQADASREDGALWVDLFELKARMKGVYPEGAISSSSATLDL
jgi:hypothetical protein